MKHQLPRSQYKKSNHNLLQLPEENYRKLVNKMSLEAKN